MRKSFRLGKDVERKEHLIKEKEHYPNQKINSNKVESPNIHFLGTFQVNTQVIHACISSVLEPKAIPLNFALMQPTLLKNLKGSTHANEDNNSCY